VKKAAVKTAAKKTTVKKKTSAKTTAAKKPAVTMAKSDEMGYTNFTPYKSKKGEEYMNADQVAHFRKILNGWKQQLMNKVDETVHHMQDEAANFPDPNDRASQESEFAMELRTRDRERKLIKKIDESLDDIDNEEYGYCEHCGVEIGIRRLEARPTATQCIDCKTLNEIREKQYGK
jgi:DnaK suppressor protein